MTNTPPPSLDQVFNDTDTGDGRGHRHNEVGRHLRDPRNAAVLREWMESGRSLRLLHDRMQVIGWKLNYTTLRYHARRIFPDLYEAHYSRKNSRKKPGSDQEIKPKQQAEQSTNQQEKQDEKPRKHSRFGDPSEALPEKKVMKIGGKRETSEEMAKRIVGGDEGDDQ